MKKCPYCAEEIQDEAIKCKHCGEKLNQPEITKEPCTVKAKSGVMDGVKIGCGMFLILPLIIIGIMLVLGFMGGGIGGCIGGRKAHYKSLRNSLMVKRLELEDQCYNLMKQKEVCLDKLSNSQACLEIEKKYGETKKKIDEIWEEEKNINR